MRPMLLLGVLASLSASAQSADEPAAQDKPAAPAPEAPADPATDNPKAPTPKRAETPRHRSDAGFEPLAPVKASTDEELKVVRQVAHAFFADLIQGDARALVMADCGLPFYVEDHRFGTSEELLNEWLKDLRDKRTDLLTLYGIEVLTPQDMEKKYGKPPARLANFPWKGQKTFIAVANLSGHAAVALVQNQPRGWRVVGYHD